MINFKVFCEESVDEAKGMNMNLKLVNRIKNSGAVKSGSMSKDAPVQKEAAPKIKSLVDPLKARRAADNAHDNAMGRTASGRKKSSRTMTSTQKALSSIRMSK